MPLSPSAREEANMCLGYTHMAIKASSMLTLKPVVSAQTSPFEPTLSRIRPQIGPQIRSRGLCGHPDRCLGRV